MKNFNKGFSQNIIIIIILAFLIIGGGVYFLSNQFNSENLDGKEESYFSEKVTDMFQKEKPLRCFTEVNSLEGQIKAVYYFDNQNKMVRVEMEVFDKNTGLTINTVSIIKDNWNYFWDDLMNKDGMKVKFDENEDSVLLTENLDLEDSDLKFDFVCKDWKVDSKKFNLPKDKSFKDLSVMIDDSNTLPSNPSNLDSNLINNSLDNLCEVCNLLPDGPDKMDCLSACSQN